MSISDRLGFGVSAGDLETLKYLKYSPESNELEAARTLTTEAATLKVGNHSISSMGENFGFTNLTTGTVWHPAWTGLKPQGILANQDHTGIVPPTFRHYTSDLLENVTNDPVQLTGAVNYEVDNIIPFEAAIFAQTVVVAEDIAPEDWLRYEVRFGTSTDQVAYLQILTGITLSAGDTLLWNFEHPVEARGGQQVNASMMISKGNQDAEQNFLQVRPGVDGVTRWGIAHIRTFTDEDVMSGVHPISTAQILRYASEYAVDTSGGQVDLVADPAIGYKSFMIFDEAGTFHQNSCIVTIGPDTFEMDRKNKQYNFWLNGSGWKWSESHRESK